MVVSTTDCVLCGTPTFPGHRYCPNCASATRRLAARRADERRAQREQRERAWRLHIDARTLLCLIQANPGLSYHDLVKDFGYRAASIASALVRLGKIEKRDRRYYPTERASNGLKD